jgi:uncharacterized protein
MTFKENGETFLANHQRIAIFGVSRHESKAHTGNVIYKALKKAGYNVVAIHPEATQLEGDVCYHTLQEVPGGVDGAIIVTSPTVTTQIVRDCDNAGVKDVWMHYNALFGKGNSSASEEAVTYCHNHQMNLIEGGCPLMFVDIGHKCMRWILSGMGKLPN